MKVLCIDKKETLLVRDFEMPQVTQKNAVIKMIKCGICGSDVTAYRGSNPTMKYPVNGIGHEGVGIIEAIEQNEKGLNKGDRVALEPYVPCNSCYMCKQGRFNNCTDIRVCGVHKDGMMAEYFSHPIQLLYKIPDEMTFTEAAFVEPLTIGLHGVARAKVGKGDWCVIFGSGTIGLMAAFGCIEKGATPILIDIVDSKLQRAKTYGFEHVINSQKEDVVQRLLELTNNKLPENLIECTGSPQVISKMHDYVCYGGRIALVGWPKAPVEINTVRSTQKELEIYTSRNSNAQFPTAMEMIKNKKLPISDLVTKEISLSEVESTILDMIDHPDNYTKVVVEIQSM